MKQNINWTAAVSLRRALNDVLLSSESVGAGTWAALERAVQMLGLQGCWLGRGIQTALARRDAVEMTMALF